MKMSGFSFNSHPSEAGWHKQPGTAWDSKKKQCDVLGIGGGITKAMRGVCEVLLLLAGTRGGKCDTSHVDSRKRNYLSTDLAFFISILALGP